MLIFAIFITAIIYLICKYPDRAIGTPKFRKLPGPRGLPILGNLISQLFHIARDKTSLQHTTGLYNKYGPIWTISLPGIGRIVGIDEPSTLEYILKRNFENYVKGDYVLSRLHDVLGHGIFATDGDAWKLQRKRASNIFKVRNFREIICKAFAEDGDLLLKILNSASNSEEELDLQGLFFRYTMDTFGKICFSRDFQCLSKPNEPNAFASAFDFAQSVIEHRFMSPFWKLTEAFTERGRKFREAVKFLDDYAYGVIRERRADPHGHAVNDLLELFMQEDMSDQELRDCLSLILFSDKLDFSMIAGRDTTAQALSWMFYRICTRPDVETRLLNEINAVLGDKTAPTYEDTHLMKYTEAVFLETLRLHPSVPRSAKIAVNDDVLPDGTFIPAGTVVSYHHYSLGRSKIIWGDSAEEFRPERFLDANGDVRKISPFIFPVFNAGPRTCLGQQFATIEVLTVVSMVLKHFRIELKSKDEPLPARSLTLPMAQPLLCRVIMKNQILITSSFIRSRKYSIILDKEGPYHKLLKRKNTPSEKEFNKLSVFEQDIWASPYGATFELVYPRIYVLGNLHWSFFYTFLVAAIATPLRRCIYHDRLMPRHIQSSIDFLIRFIRLYDEKTHRLWLLPDITGKTYRDKRHGLAFYIRSRADVINALTREGKYKQIESKAYWRPDMVHHVWRILLRDLKKEWGNIKTTVDNAGVKLQRTDLFIPMLKDNRNQQQYDVHSNSRRIPGLQCILVLDGQDEGNTINDGQKQLPMVPSSPIATSVSVGFVSSRTNQYSLQPNIMAYDIRKIWGEEGLNNIKNMLDEKYKDECRAVGVVRHVTTKWFALTLWKLLDYTE
ncbi:9054_t:CDS:10 [Paraglomus occultum]|uniref:9054_t:CDS:1 n=1 Tax=Paraglomus occultum TaxID=144539 RepID=A0A9N9A081_9GLOM|nr:9054_t:CDS:10 [Paraglomus occultum]